MIVIGYQGIGKSTLSKQSDKYIDLESGNFWVDDENGSGKKRDTDWYKAYCNIAIHLSQQGYIVMTSSHKEVRDYLKNTDEIVVTCVPSLDLKSQWIHRLQSRYEESGLDKDLKALKNAENCYEENITDIINSGYPCICLTNMDYVLSEYINQSESLLNS